MSERDRRVLHRRLVQHLGEQEADSLMDLLPPAGGAELVTKSDLRLELQTMKAELSAMFHRDMVRQTWVLTGTLLAGLGALGGLLR